ncbi:MAG: sugar kinase [Rhizobiaceae bacterium]
MSVASIGECMLELSGSDGRNWRMGFAGDTFNTLWALRALTDMPCDYVSAFGDDPFSTQQIAFMAEAGIGVAGSPVIAGARPGLYAITLDGAERSFTYWRSDAAARRLADDPKALATSLAGRKLIYFSGITLAILTGAARQTLLTSLKDARQTGALIAFDPNHRGRLWQDVAEARATFAAALDVTDIALPTFPDEQALFGDAAPEATAARLAEAGVNEIVVKNGSAPALLAIGGGRETIPATSVEAIDTTGAGDAFNGAYLAARLAGIEPGPAVSCAHRVAAAVVQVHGALAPVATLRAAFATPAS